jgi:hypothetical protein
MGYNVYFPKESKMQKAVALVFVTLILLISSLASADLIQPEIVDKPIFKPKDTWTFRINDRSRNGETKERRMVMSIVRSSSKSVLQSAKAADSSLPPIEKLLGADLSLSDSINGQEVIVHKPFDFPMKIGKKWNVLYEKENPTKNIKKHRIELQYEGIGWEEVSVTGGKFQAFKVEAEGTWRDEFNPTPMTTGSTSQIDKDGAVIVVKNLKPFIPAPITGKIFRTYWYVPAIKREIKSIEEQFTTDGSLASKSTWELDSYMLDGLGNSK